MVAEALKAQTPTAGLAGVRIFNLEKSSAEPFDVRFEIETGSNRVIVLGEIKPSFTPKSLEAIAPWIARLKAVQSDTAFAVIAPYLSSQAQEYCIEKGIDFIDLAGNISINVPGGFVLRRVGMKGKQVPEKRMSSRILNVYSGKASRVLRVLLQKPGQWRLTQIASEIAAESRTNPFTENSDKTSARTFKLSLGTISKALSTLEQELWVRRRNSNVYVPEPRRLLIQWAEKYKERYRYRLRSSLKCVNPFGRELSNISKALSPFVPVSYAFTGVAAASLYAPFADLDMIEIFVTSPESAQRFRQLKGGAASGPDLRIISPYDFGVFMYAPADAGVPLVSDVQVYLDLYARGGRDLKQADYLLERRIMPRWEQK